MLHRVITTVWFMLCPAVALAAEAKPVAAADLLDMLIKAVVAVAVAAVPILLKRWLGTKVSSETINQLEQLADQAVSLAEEKAHQQVKLGRTKLSSNDKLEAAANFLVQEALAHGLTEIGSGQAKQLVESALGASRTQP